MKGQTLVLFLFVSISNIVWGQNQVARKTPYGRGYLEFLPAGYTSSTDLFPCIIFLHGAGERGDGSPAALEKVKTHGTPKFIKNGATMCFVVNGKSECFVVLSPQQTTNRWGWQGDVIPFIQFALSNYRIDPNRVYLTGLSMGGDGSWDTSYAAENEPNYLTAVAPVSCKGDYNGAKVTASRKVPVWAFHGDSDTAVPLSDGKRPINGMNSVNANPSPVFTIVAGGGHNGSTWDKVYSPSNTYYSPNIYEWFLSKSKQPASLPPVANAGPDQVITLPTNTAILNGSGSDADGEIVSYSWAQLSGPTSVTVSQWSSRSLSVGDCAVGSYTFRLTVTDNQNKTASDDVSLNVVSNVNQPPVVQAGNDVTLYLPANSVDLSAVASDQDGSIVSYQWVKTWGPTATLANTNTSKLSFTGTIKGTYTFRVTVTDNAGATSSDDIRIIIKGSLPVANAGADLQIVAPQSEVMLEGSGTDADGTIISYLWQQTSGPTAVMSAVNQPVIQVSQLNTLGEYVFMLTVTDNENQKAIDYVKVVVSKQTTTQSYARSAPLNEYQEESVTGLNQNYPNPFSSQTSIPFSLQSRQHVRLKVYDFTGAEIQTLVDEELAAGDHTVVFSPAVPGKFFIIRLQANGKIFSSKALQVRY